MAARDGRTYGDVLGDVLIAGFIQLYVAFTASMCVVLLRQDGGEWWVLAFIIVAVVVRHRRLRSGARVRHATRWHRGSARRRPGRASPVPSSPRSSPVCSSRCSCSGLDWWMGIVFGLVILGTATVGDLGESMIKRDLGIKDMSSWLPGHGGVLDRLDSILLSGDRRARALLPLHPPGGIP